MPNTGPNNRPIRIYVEALEEITYINPAYSKHILRHIDVTILDLQ